MRSGVLMFAGLLMWVSALPAAEPARALREDLIWVDYPLHVLPEGRALTADEQPPVSPKTSPAVKLRTAAFNDAVFDVAEVLRSHGLSMPRGGRALFCPKAALLYVRATAQDLELVRDITRRSPPMVDRRVSFAVDLNLQFKPHDAKARQLVEAKAVPFVSGQRFELAAKGDTSFELKLEPVIGPDGETLDLDIDLMVSARGQAMSFRSRAIMHLSKSHSITLDSAEAGSVVLGLRLHRTMEYVGPPALETTARKAAAIKAIATALRKEGK